MFDPFAVALDAQFRAPGSAAATYLGANREVIAIRVIRRQPDQVSRFGVSRIVQASNAFDIRRREIPEPEAGATLTVENAYSVFLGGVLVSGDKFALVGAAELDNEGLTWTVGAVPE